MSAIPTVPVQLDKERHLRYDLNAMVKAERATGKPLSELSRPSMQDLRVLLWVGLLHEDPNLTEEQVGESVHMGNIKELMSAVTEAWGGAQPENKNGSGEGDLPLEPEKPVKKTVAKEDEAPTG